MFGSPQNVSIITQMRKKWDVCIFFTIMNASNLWQITRSIFQSHWAHVMASHLMLGHVPQIHQKRRHEKTWFLIQMTSW